MTTIGLVVGDSTTLTSGDTAIQSILTGAGYSVTVVDDQASVPGGVDGYVLCESCSPTNLGTKYRDLTVPVVTFEVGTNHLLNMRMSSDGTALSSGGNGTQWYVEDHETTWGVATGLQTVRSSNAARYVEPSGFMCAGATITMRLASASSSITGFVVETGGALTTGTAPARRVFMGISNAFAQALTATGNALVLQHVEWAIPMDPVDLESWNGDGLSAGTMTNTSEGTGDSDIGTINGSTMSIEVAGTRAPRIKWTGGNTGYAVWGHTAYKKVAHRFYYTVSSSFGGGHRVALAWSTAAGAPAWMLDINGSGDVYLLNGAGSTLDNSSGSLLDLDTQYRFEITYDRGKTTVYIYEEDGTTPLDTLVGSATSTTITEFWWGTTFDTSRGNAYGDAMKVVARYSALIGPAPAPGSVPDAPTIGLAIAAAEAGVISWTPPVDDGGSSITQYHVTPYLDGTTPGTPQTTSDGVTTMLVVTGLTPGEDYTFTVIATNSLGDSAESAESNSITAQTETSMDPRGALFERTDLKYGSAIGAWEFNQGDAFDVPAAAARVAALGVTIIRYQMWRVPTELGGTQPMSDMEDALDAIIGIGAIPLVGLPPISSHQWEENVDGTDPWTTAWQELVIETAVAKGVTLFEMGNEPDNYGPPHGAGGIFFSGHEYFDQLWSGVPDLKDYARTTLSTEIFIGGPSWANLYSGNIEDITDWLGDLKTAYLLDGNRDWIPDFVSGHTYLQTPSEHTESAANLRIADWVTNLGTLQTYINDEFDGMSDQGFPLVNQMRLAITEYNDTIENESTINDTQTWTDFYYDAMFTFFETIDAFIAIQFTMLSHEGGALDLLELDGDRKPAYISFRQIIAAAIGISGGNFTVWNGTEELPVASVTFWNGTEEVPIGSLEVST